MKLFQTILILMCIVTSFKCTSPELTSARLYLQRSDWVNAEKSLMKEVENNPKNGEAWYLLGFTRLNLQNFEGMLTAFEKSLAITQEYAKKISDSKRAAWAQSFNRGALAHNLSNTAPPDSVEHYTQKAINEYNMAIRIAPDSVVNYQNLASLFYSRGNLTEQINCLKKARSLSNSPEFSTYIINAYIQMGENALSKGNKDEAKENFNNAIIELSEVRKNDPDNMELIGTMINVYIAADRANEALPFLREAVYKNPSNKIFQNNLGLLLMQADSLNEAIKHFEAALSVDSLYEEALRNGAVAYLKLGERIKTRVTEEEEKGRKSENATREYIENFKKSALLLKRLSTIRSDDPNVWDAIATAYGSAGMFKEAREALENSDKLRKKEQ